MGKQTSQRVKWILTVLLLVSLVVSLTAASVSARSCGKEAQSTQEKDTCTKSVQEHVKGTYERCNCPDEAPYCHGECPTINGVRKCVSSCSTKPFGNNECNCPDEAPYCHGDCSFRDGYHHCDGSCSATP